MGKKESASKGERPSVNKKIRNAMRRDTVASGDRLMNQLKSHKAGKKTAVTIENPNKNETNKRYIKIDGKHYFRNDAKGLAPL